VKLVTRVKLLALIAVLIPSIGSAQDFPTKAVTIVIPFSPGGSNDTVGRYLAESLGKLWKQTVVVENKAGGGTVIGTSYVANSPPDGYRMLLVSSSFSTNAATRADQAFDPSALRPAAMVATGHVAVVTGPRVPMASLADLAKEAKAKPLFYATSGVGSSQHFYGELLKDVMGIDMTAVPYRGGNEGLVDLTAGRVDVLVGTLAGLVQAIDTGRAKPIAVLSKTRSRLYPNMPTTAEAGYPAALIANYFAVLVPAKTPDAVVNKIHQDIRAVTHTPEGIQFLAKLDSEPSELTPEQVSNYLKKEIESLTKLAKKLNVIGK
jgi:tripartite-type tricarboxylate transporter receptor subunit TctC